MRNRAASWSSSAARASVSTSAGSRTGNAPERPDRLPIDDGGRVEARHQPDIEPEFVYLDGPLRSLSSDKSPSTSSTSSLGCDLAAMSSSTALPEREVPEPEALTPWRYLLEPE
jgi:hypothetical protein